MDDKESWNHARNLIQSQAQISDIRDALSKLTKEKIEDTYEDGLNLLHYAISTNDLQVARFLFEEELFLPPHEYGSVPYLHMACLYGFSDMVDLLLEKRPSEKNSKVSANDEHWKRLVASVALEGDENEIFQARMNSVENKETEISAYEVAALRQQLACLESLLNENPRDEWLRRMVELDELSALEFLLTTDLFEITSLSSAFEASLLVRSTQCLEMMLKYAAKHSVCFTNKNPYYCLYECTPRSSELCNSGLRLAQCTRLLISYGWDVNVMDNQATFPLYCLLRRIRDYDVIRFLDNGPFKLETLDEELACLNELLSAGANPNFDEKSDDYSKLPMSEGGILGRKRPAFSSAAEALAFLLRRNTNSCLTEFFSQAASLLVNYGCCMMGQRSWLSKMIHVEDTTGLEMLLATMKFDMDALNYGFEKSLHRMSACSLETMLQYAAKNNITFQQRHPFHLLIMCLYHWDSNWVQYCSAIACTRVLISHGWSVNEVHPPAQYPLYTWLWLAAASHDPLKLEEASDCIGALLAEGANPNFDESTIEPDLVGISTSAFEANINLEIQELCPRESKRKMYSSAAAGLMDVLELGGLDKLSLAFVSQTVADLVKYGCDLSYTDDAGRSVIHFFMMNIFVTFEYYQVEDGEAVQGLVNKVMSDLLECGVDIQGRDQFFNLPLTYFTQKLSENISWFGRNFLGDVQVLEALGVVLKPIFRFLDVMEVKEAHEIATECMDALEYSALCGDIHVTVLDGLKKVIRSHLKVRSLYDLCCIKMWRYCGCKLAKTQNLELPLNIKQSLKEMLSF